MPTPLIRTTSILCLSLLAAMSTSDAASWEPLPPLPAPNGGALCGVIDQRIVVAGGTNWEGGTKNWLRTVHVFDPEAGMWTSRGELASGPVAYGLAVASAGRMAIVGGSDGRQSLRALTWLSAGESQTIRVPALPAALVLTAGGAVGRQIVIVGGTDDAANVRGVQRTTHLLEERDGAWTVTHAADYPGEPVAVAASAVTGDELFVFAGMHYDAVTEGVRNGTGAYAFSPARNTWRALAAFPVANRGVQAVALDSSRIYLAGGFTDAFTADGWIYDTRTDRYTAATPLPHAAMVSLVVSDGWLYCLGGEDKMKSRTDRCFRIRLAEVGPLDAR